MIVVTGAAGFIGSCMIRKLNDEGFNHIIAVDEFSNENKQANLKAKKILLHVARNGFFKWLNANYVEVEFILHLGARTDTVEKNWEVFGKCNNQHYHGHNYELIVQVYGEIDPETGYVIDMKILKDIIKSEVENPFDHKNLNLDTEEFKNLNPTAENIAVVIWNKLRKKINQTHELTVILYETERNFVEYAGE